MENHILIFIVLLSAVILCFGMIKEKPEIIINFILRFVSGILCIYFLNNLFQKMQMNLFVGLNEATTLTAGFLGIPGIILLYGLAFYFGNN